MRGVGTLAAPAPPSISLSQCPKYNFYYLFLRHETKLCLYVSKGLFLYTNGLKCVWDMRLGHRREMSQTTPKCPIGCPILNASCAAEGFCPEFFRFHLRRLDHALVFAAL